VTKKIIEKYGDRVSLAYLDFPLRERTMVAAEAAQCAGRQDKFWEYHDLLFRNVASWNRGPDPQPIFDDMASDLGLDTKAFSACMDSNATRGEIEDSRSAGRSLGVSSTPTLFINDKKIVGYLSLPQFEREIEAALQKVGQAK
jgi:protein-disulfide isomerase